MTNRPRVQLIGDSITMAYAPLVAERLAETAVVLAPPANAGDGANLLAHLDEWVLDSPPDLLHVNCGLHDLKRARPGGDYQQSLDSYRADLGAIVRHLTAAMPGRVVWATITPVLFERHRARKDFDRHPSDVDAYNEAARAIMRQFGVPVNDLHAAICAAGVERCLGEDGVHMSEAGNAVLAEAVSATIREVLVQ